MMRIIDEFCKWTGLKVNANKSQILFGKAVGITCRKKLTRILDFKSVNEWKYLGIKMSINRLKAADFQDILVQEIEKLCRNFVWHKSNSERGLHFVAWDELCKPRRAGGLGLQSCIIKSGTMKARIALNYIQNPYSLLHRSLKARYSDNIFEGNCKHNSSVAWKIMIEGGKYLKEVVKCKVLNDDGNWDEIKLRFFFHEDLTWLIKQVKVVKEGGRDMLEPIKKLTGCSISALAFEAVMNKRHNDIDDGFINWLKKLKLNVKVELFWWRLSKFAIPTNSFLKYRRLATSDFCVRGCGMTENYEHIVVQCKHITYIITKIREWGFAISLFQSLDECLVELRRQSSCNPGMVRLYCTTVFWNWKNRNMVKHGKPAISASMAAANVISLASSNLHPLLYSWGANLSWEYLNSWHPPPLDWIKVNVDSLLLSNYRASIGGIFSDNKGRMLLAFGRNSLHWDSGQLELESVFAFRDFIQVWMLEYIGIIIESDNLNVINYIQQSMKKTNWQTEKILGNKLYFLNDFNKVVFHHGAQDEEIIREKVSTDELLFQEASEDEGKQISFRLQDRRRAGGMTSSVVLRAFAEDFSNGSTGWSGKLGNGTRKTKELWGKILNAWSRFMASREHYPIQPPPISLDGRD
ncbi:uncharacterized protein LOC110093242 [Dendrobium catenatum]|uniref:uncharacterized protein LOC110093242 n=1 Tax=Dendrobium catenatum TaxID=906689 RepID=UPI0009F286CA|nr:uncharacterized protein LOC110093242 [Dendrobium catenatum]